MQTAGSGSGDGRRIISISMVKNEQDIIEPFIRHNARFVDCMVILDKASVDETRRIAMDCARELGKIVVADNDEFSHKQAELITRALHGCQSAFYADFVLFLDADEFLGAVDRSSLLKQLEAIPAGGVGLIPWRTYVLSPGGSLGVKHDPPRSLRLRRTSEQPLYQKAVLRLDRGDSRGLRVKQGSHDVVTEAGAALATVELPDLPLLHFPVRSRQQFTAKGIVGWMAYLAKNPAYRYEAQPNGYQKRDAFERVMAAPDELGAEELAEISMRYAQARAVIDWNSDAVESFPPIDYVRRYSTGAFGEPLTIVGRSWERSLSTPPPFLERQRLPTPVGAQSSGGTSFDAARNWDNLFVDVAPFRYIAEKYRPASVLDIGCGVGAHLQIFRNLGATNVLGVDGVPAEATMLSGDEYVEVDLKKSLVDLHRTFDLVVCVQVVERLHATVASILLQAVCRHAVGAIVFSAAEPGQPGNENINCRPISHWLALFAERGWYPDLIDSLGVRSLATLSWFHRNLIVLKPGDERTGSRAIEALSAIGRMPFTWHEQRPGIRQWPFTELAECRETEATPATSERREFESSRPQAATERYDRVLSIGDLPQASHETLYSVDAIAHDGVKMPAGSTVAPLAVRRGTVLNISGWAVDNAAKLPAGGVITLVDGESPQVAKYGTPRSDVAHAFGERAYESSGFLATIETSSLAPGQHTIGFAVLDRAGRRFYQMKSIVEIKVF